MEQIVLEDRSAAQKERQLRFMKAIATYARALERRADMLSYRYSPKISQFWITRGKEKLLREVARDFQRLRVQHCESSLAFFLAIQEYQHCLETRRNDVQEEALEHESTRFSTIEYWQAEGEFRVLLGLCKELAEILQEFEKDDQMQRYVLSADGKQLVDLAVL